jgi:hypothetical protein
MKKTVWTYGLISGALVSAMMAATIPFQDENSFNHSLIRGSRVGVLRRHLGSHVFQIHAGFHDQIRARTSWKKRTPKGPAKRPSRRKKWSSTSLKRVTRTRQSPASYRWLHVIAARTNNKER